MGDQEKRPKGINNEQIFAIAALFGMWQVIDSFYFSKTLGEQLTVRVEKNQSEINAVRQEVRNELSQLENKILNAQENSEERITQRMTQISDRLIQSILTRSKEYNDKIRQIEEDVSSLKLRLIDRKE